MIRTLVMMMWCALASVGLCEPTAGVSPARVFDVDGRPARAGLVTAPWVESPKPGEHDNAPASPMLRALTGVIGELSARDLARLRRSVVTRTRVPGSLTVREPIVSILLRGPSGPTRIEIERVEHGWILARTADGSVRARLERGVIDDLLESWGGVRPDPALEQDQPQPKRVFACLPPLSASPIRLDDTTIRERFAAGGRSPFAEPMTRDLTEERLFVRLPVGHRSDRPSGLLVWISPIPHGEPPETLSRAADEHGLICISAENSGNTRPAIDRAQLALDAVATASSRWWIDPERVIVSGMSGGGRMASMMWACFPDVFTGGIGVVGMNSHHLVGIGDGRFWPKTHERARGELGRRLAAQRFAAVSGPKDYNFREIQGRARKMAREGLAVRVFDFANLGHTMPTPEQFTRAVNWVLLPVVERRSASTTEAQRVLDRYLRAHGAGPPPDARAGQILERVTIVGPWTEPAWRAAELLGHTEPAPELTPEPAVESSD